MEEKSKKLTKEYEEKTQIMLSKLKLFQESMKEMMKHSKCAICMECFIKPATLECGHTFCFECINQWKFTRNETEKIICPICRYLNSNFITKNPVICDIISELQKLSIISI